MSKLLDEKTRREVTLLSRELRITQNENEQSKQRIAQLESEKAELRENCMEEDGLYDNEDVEEILKSSRYGSWIKTANADEHPELHTPNLNFVTPDMSQTLGKGTHVLIDVNSIPPELKSLLVRMMDQLNSNTLRISTLENC